MPSEPNSRKFRNICWAYDKITGSNLGDPKTTYAIYCVQMTHQIKIFYRSNKRRYNATDNFCIRHVLALQLRVLSDDEIRIIGTVLIYNVDSVSFLLLTESISTMCNNARVQWLLVQSFDEVSYLKDVSRIAGEVKYVLFKDCNIFVFYTAYLTTTLTVPIPDRTWRAI